MLFDAEHFLHGYLWQPFTYSFVHPGLLGTLFELLSLWFLAGFLEGFHNSNWVTSLYAVSVLGTAAAALALYVVAGTLAPSLLGSPFPLYGCFGGIFGLLAAIGLLYGDVQFMLFPLPIGIKARYLVDYLRAHRGRHALWPGAAVRLCATGRGAGRPALRAPGAAARGFLRAQRELVRPAQPLLPLEAPPRGPQIRGLHAPPGPHRQVRRPGAPDRRRPRRQEALELKKQGIGNREQE